MGAHQAPLGPRTGTHADCQSGADSLGLWELVRWPQLRGWSGINFLTRRMPAAAASQPAQDPSQLLCGMGLVLGRIGVEPEEALDVDPAETLAAMAELHGQGRALNLGVSNFSTVELSEAREASPVPLVVDQVDTTPSSTSRSCCGRCASTTWP